MTRPMRRSERILAVRWLDLGGAGKRSMARVGVHDGGHNHPTRLNDVNPRLPGLHRRPELTQALGTRSNQNFLDWVPQASPHRMDKSARLHKALVRARSDRPNQAQDVRSGIA